MPASSRRLYFPFLLAALVAVVTARAGTPPSAPLSPVTDTYHGVAVTDPYRALENWSDPEVRTWSEAQNAYARAHLDSLPHAESIRARITEIMSAQSVGYGSLRFVNGKLFASKRQPPRQQPMIVVLDSPQHPESARVIVDPNVINPKGTTAFDWFVPSPDGKLLAVSLSEGGSELGDLHLYEVETGREVFEVIPHVQNGTGGGSLGWEPDSRGFFYTRYPRGDERPAADSAFYLQVYHHRLGTPTAEDRYELGRDFPKIAEVEINASPEGVILVSMQKGDGGEFQHYVRSLDSKWTQITRYEDRVVQAELGNATDGATLPLYLISRQGAPNGKLLKLDVACATGAGADLTKAVVLVPEGRDALVSDYGDRMGNFAATGPRIYVVYQTGGPSEIRAFDLQGNPVPAPAQLPVSSVSGLTAVTPQNGQLMFRNTSYIDYPALYLHDPATGTCVKSALSAKAPVDFADCEVVREWAASKDGTKIPVNIVRRKGQILDGTAPCLVTGYGGYGLSQSPGFNPVRRVLMDLGFIFAEANLRGGGEFGDEWHRQGNLTRKQNVFDDFAAACQHMITAGYTNSGRLAIQGGSNGGLLMGAVLTQHPALVRCVVSSAGIYDMIRVEFSPNGAFNITEFGTIKDEAQFKALLAYSPYHHVQDGVKYPPVLFMTGANDPRVEPAQSRKMTARLQAAGATCYLRTSAHSGHGMGSSLSQRIEQAVDVYSFLIDELGVAAQSGGK